MKNPLLEADSWHFRKVKLDRVIDGDTFEVIIDLGYETWKHPDIRLFGVDTAETHGVKHSSEEFARGIVHEKFVREWFDAASEGGEWPLSIISLDETDRWGRYSSVITRKTDGESLTIALRNRFDDV